MDLRKSAAAATCLLAACASAPAWAVLGGTADSVRNDAAVLKSQIAPRVTTESAYTVQRLSLDSGTVVDQYISSAGKVFALTWRGPFSPDLSQLLGDYYTEFQAASGQPHPRQSLMQVDTGRMRYSKGGHMRDYWGSAYVPELLPPGLSMEDLK